MIAFTGVLNRPNAEGLFAEMEVVAGFPGGSPDVPSSFNRVEGFTQKLRDKGIKIYDSIPEMLKNVDVVLLEEVDGRPHLELARPVIAAGKPLFIDKPLAGSLADAVAIAELARKHNVPCFSCSSVRYSPSITSLRDNEEVGEIEVFQFKEVAEVDAALLAYLRSK